MGNHGSQLCESPRAASMGETQKCSPPATNGGKKKANKTKSLCCFVAGGNSMINSRLQFELTAPGKEKYGKSPSTSSSVGASTMEPSCTNDSLTTQSSDGSLSSARGTAGKEGSTAQETRAASSESLTIPCNTIVLSEDTLETLAPAQSSPRKLPQTELLCGGGDENAQQLSDAALDKRLSCIRSGPPPSRLSRPFAVDPKGALHGMALAKMITPPIGTIAALSNPTLYTIDETGSLADTDVDTDSEASWALTAL